MTKPLKVTLYTEGGRLDVWSPEEFREALNRGEIELQAGDRYVVECASERDT